MVKFSAGTDSRTFLMKIDFLLTSSRIKTKISILLLSRDVEEGLIPFRIVLI